MSKSLIKLIVTRAVALILASVLIGIAFNKTNPVGVRWHKANGEISPEIAIERPPAVNNTPPDLQQEPTPAEGEKPPQTVSWEHAQLLVAANEAVLVDARPSTAYEEGHIPGSVSLPYKSIRDEMLAFMKKYDIYTVLIVYCGDSDCVSSEKVAKLLINEYGYKNVLHMPGGYAEWQRAQASSGQPRKQEKKQ